MAITYLLKRFVLAALTLLVLSWIVFGLARCSSASTDQLEIVSDGEGVSSQRFMQQTLRTRHLLVKQAGLNKPLFYFTIGPALYPDTLYRVWEPTQRRRMTRLAASIGNWETVQHREALLKTWQQVLADLPAGFASESECNMATALLLQADNPTALKRAYENMEMLRTRLTLPDSVAAHLQNLQASNQRMMQVTQTGQMNKPAFYWYGTDNQYHKWLSGFFTGQLGVDKEGNPIGQRLKMPLLITLFVNGLALLLAYLIAIPLGVRMARYKGLAFDRWGQRGLFIVYALPTFSLGILLMWLFGRKMTSPPPQLPDETFIYWFFKALPHAFLLPVITLTLHALTQVAFQMRGGMLDALNQNYIRTARAKGLDEDRVYWRHAFRNALFPVITLFATALPAIFSGSVVLEMLFNYQGVGLLLVTSFTNQNYPVLFALLMLSAVLTIAGILLADLLYTWADPRVRYGSSQ